VEALQEEHFERTGQQWARTISGSMAPMIRVDDLVRIERIDPASARFGDVILIAGRDQRVIHRVVGKCRHQGCVTFVEKGDMNAIPGHVAAASIRGRVSMVESAGRTLYILSGKGRLLQIALAWCSIGPVVVRQRLDVLCHWPAGARLCRHLTRKCGRAAAWARTVLLRLLWRV
jgi:signal peptidase I